MDRIIENVNSYVENLNDGDSDSELNPEQLLNEWLGELDNLTVVSKFQISNQIFVSIDIFFS